MPYKDTDERKAYSRQWYVENRKGVLSQQKRYREENPQKVKDTKRRSNQKNKKKLAQWFKSRRQTNLQYRLRLTLRSRLYQALRGCQRRGSAVRDLGISIPEFKDYIESRFQRGMTWDNWGLWGWHLDHIKPLVSFDLTKRRQLLEACHYTNLRPLWATANMRRKRK